MEKTPTVFDLISMWPTRRALSEDIGVSVDRVHKWATAGTIPAKFHLGILEAAQVRGFAITAEQMVRMHATQVRGAA